jgi:hypothetical protein
MGTYKGKPASDDSVKKTVVFQGIDVHIDRPKGFEMTGKDADGNPWKRVYRYDYGFIPKTLGGDDDGLDVFIGPDSKASAAYWALQNKPDGKFDEYKVFLGFPNREAALAAYRAHIPLKLLGGMTTMGVDLMKAMLGVNPGGMAKAAMVYASCMAELERA